MNKYNFNNKNFALIDNSENGNVNKNTIFEYQQQGDVVTANYSGGSIKHGKIVALLKGNQLDMLYHCLTNDNELKAGKAIANISLDENEKIKLVLNWEWLTHEKQKGTSEYIEL